MAEKPVIIEHLRVLKIGEADPTGAGYGVELTAPCHQELLARFSPVCRMNQVRRINWRQSFARRGFSENDYVFEREERDVLSTEYLFKRRENADKTLPVEVRFIEGWEASKSWTGVKLEPIVLHYLQMIPLLKAWQSFVMHVSSEEAPKELMDFARHRRWVGQRRCAIWIRDRLPPPRSPPAMGSIISRVKLFEAGVLDAWDDSTSFVSVHL
jgi:hypothetical protein